jgi:hypothetical protein
MPLVATLSTTQVSSQMIKSTALGVIADKDITGGAAKIYMLDCLNNHGSALGYLKIFDTAAPVVGTTSPVIVIPIAGAQRQVITIAEGITLGNGLSWAFVNAAGTAGTGAITGGALTIAVIKAG